jgi:hypothetical protein
VGWGIAARAAIEKIMTDANSAFARRLLDGRDAGAFLFT